MNPSTEIVKAAATELGAIRADQRKTPRETLTVHINVAWWVRPYLYTLACFCWLHGTEPNPNKLRRVLKQGVTAKRA